MTKSQDDRIESVPVVREIFTSTGVVDEIFVFEGSPALDPNGLIDVSIKEGSQWTELKTNKYELTTNALGFQFVDGYILPTGTLVKVNYLSPAISITGTIGIEVPVVLNGGFITLPATFGAQTFVRGATIKAKDTNAITGVFVNGFELLPGESVPVEIDNLSKVLVIGTAGDIVYWIGS